MSMVEHARRELELAGLFDDDSDYGGMVGKAVLKAVEAWAEEGHSGFSHAYCLAIFNKLVNGEQLTPLTRSPGEWEDISSMSAEPIWQNKRNSQAFSHDGGRTYYLVSEIQDVIGCPKCEHSRFTTGHPWQPQDDDVCSCGEKFVIIKHGKTREEATRESADVIAIRAMREATEGEEDDGENADDQDRGCVRGQG